MVEAFRPRKLPEALKWLKEKKALPLAGGTDLMVHFRNYSGTESRINSPVLFTDAIGELRSIEDCGDYLRIGASSLLSELEFHVDVPLLLKKAISQIAAPALRNRATIGGNICNASPAGDTLPPLYIYDAQLILGSYGGTRTISISRFITGPGKTVLAEDELLTHIEIPKAGNEFSYYRKVGTRAANALSKLSAGGIIKVENNIIRDFRMAFGAVAPVIIREQDVEKLIIGRTADDINPAVLCDAYEPFIKPIDDQRSTAQYRKEVTLNLVRDFVNKIQESL